MNIKVKKSMELVSVIRGHMKWYSDGVSTMKRMVYGDKGIAVMKIPYERRKKIGHLE